MTASPVAKVCADQVPPALGVPAKMALLFTELSGNDRADVGPGAAEARDVDHRVGELQRRRGRVVGDVGPVGEAVVRRRGDDVGPTVDARHVPRVLALAVGQQLDRALVDDVDRVAGAVGEAADLTPPFR